MAGEIRVDRITSSTGINTISFTGDGFTVLTNVGIGTTNIGITATSANTQKLNVGIVTAFDLYARNIYQDGAPVVAGAGGTWQANNVGIYTSKIVGVNTTNITGTARSEGAIQAHGNIAVIDGILLTDQTIDGEVTIPSGRNGLLVGPVSISVGSTVTVQSGSTLVVV